MYLLTDSLIVIYFDVVAFV